MVTAHVPVRPLDPLDDWMIEIAHRKPSVRDSATEIIPVTLSCAAKTLTCPFWYGYSGMLQGLLVFDMASKARLRATTVSFAVGVF